MIKKIVAFSVFILTSCTNGAYQNFNDFLDPEQIINPHKLPASLNHLVPTKQPVIWSILIATIQERHAQFKLLALDLLRQIKTLGLEEQVEIVFYPDDRQVTVGYKRNQLINCAQGQYISFIDDDDLVHANYVGLIYPHLLTNPDCVKLVGVMTQPGHAPILRVHSIKYPEYLNTPDCLYRPPTHLNPMRKSIANQFKFLETNFGEDKYWTMQIAKSGLLKIEADMTEPYYFYQFDPELSATWSGRFESMQALTQQLLNQNLAAGHKTG